MNPLHNYDQWKAGGYSATVDEWEDWAERIVKSFRAELEAAKKDFDQIGQLLLERDTIKAALDVAMNENQRLTKLLEDSDEWSLHGVIQSTAKEANNEDLDTLGDKATNYEVR